MKIQSSKAVLNLLSSCFHSSVLGPTEFDFLLVNEDVKDRIGNVNDDDP